MQIHSVLFALSRQIDKQKVCEYNTINVVCAGNQVFVKYQAQGGGVNGKLKREVKPQPLPPPCVRPWH